MKRLARLPSRRAWRGFTLIEMLVTLALMAMISALLWQALQQVLRVEQLLQRSGVDGQLEVVRREWVRRLIQASLVEQTEAPRQLQGDANQLTVVSAEALNLPGLRSERLRLRFETDARSGRQRLLVEKAPAADAFTPTPNAPVELLAWRGQAGHVRFMDVSGAWFEQWPPPPETLLAAAKGEDERLRAAYAAVPYLPRAVWLDLGSEAGGPLVVSPSVTERGRMRRAEWEKQ